MKVIRRLLRLDRPKKSAQQETTQPARVEGKRAVPQFANQKERDAYFGATPDNAVDMGWEGR